VTEGTRTRNQAVARIADRSAYNSRLFANSSSRCFRDIWGPKRIGVMTLLSGSRDVIGHVTIRFAISRFNSYWLSFETERLYPAIFEIFTV